MVRILGGGPAGAAAAIAARGEGAPVELYEPSPVPRHRVCGEFLSPEALPLLDSLGVLGECARARPARIARFTLRVGRWEKSARLPEPAWGFSRYRLDRILLDRAAALGVRIVPERRTEADVDVVASGRPGFVDVLARDFPQIERLARRVVPGGKIQYDHLFGFKAHFRGPSTDAVELYFSRFGYAGVSAVEDGLVNVCGLVHEHVLEEHGRDPDALLASQPAVAARLSTLSRKTGWLVAGPVMPTEDLTWRRSGPYLAGDRLGTFEPFTGTGILAALLSGSMAGRAAARRTAVSTYFSDASRILGRPFLFASAFAAALDTGLALFLTPLVPAGWLFRLTRPSRRCVQAAP